MADTAVNPVTAFVNKIFESKLKGLAKEGDITQDAITEIIKGDKELNVEFNGFNDKAEVVTAAKAQFNTYVTSQINNIKHGFTSNTPTYKPNQKEIVIPLRGLEISNLAKLQKDGITKAELINSGNDLKLTIDTTKTLPATIQFTATYKGVDDDMFQIGLNRVALNNPPPVKLTNKVAKFTLEEGVALEAAIIEAYNKDANNSFTIAISGKDVTFTRKDDKTVDNSVDVTLNVTAGSKTDEKLTFKIQPETAGEAESSAMWWTKIGLMGVGALAALGGFFMGDQENQGPKIATGLGVGALVAGLFMYFGWGGKKDAPPAAGTT